MPLSMNTAIVEALTGIATQATDVIADVAPVGITIMGAFLVWNLGIIL